MMDLFCLIIKNKLSYSPAYIFSGEDLYKWCLFFTPGIFFNPFKFIIKDLKKIYKFFTTLYNTCYSININSLISFFFIININYERYTIIFLQIMERLGCIVCSKKDNFLLINITYWNNMRNIIFSSCNSAYFIISNKLRFLS